LAVIDGLLALRCGFRDQHLVDELAPPRKERERRVSARDAAIARAAFIAFVAVAQHL
jgi:hypothetical protein